MSESTSGNPDDLKPLVTHWVDKSTGLWEELQRLLDKQAAVVAGSDMTAATSNALPGGSQVLASWDANTRYVAVVEAALRAADQWDGSVATVSGETIDAIFAANQVTAPSGPIEVPKSEFAGMPVTSGYVDDPICAANGNFVHVEHDLFFPGWSGALDVTRVYSSIAADADWARPGPFGPGWASLLDVRVDPPDDASGPPRALLADGALVELHDDGTGRHRPRGARRLWAERTDGGWSVHEGPVRTLHFDETGRFVGMVAGAATVDVERDAADRVVALTERRSGRRVSYRWDDDRVIAVESGDGRDVTYRYDEARALIGVERPSGAMTYGVDGALIVSVTDADGVRFAFNRYDRDGRVVEQTNEFGRTTTYSYSEHGTTVVADTEHGPRNALVHDARGNLTALVDGSGRTMRITYDERCRAVHIVKRDGGEVTQRFDDDDNIVERVDPDGLVTRWEWDDAGRLVAEQHRNGATTTYEYDGDHRHPRRIVEPGGAALIDVDEADRPRRITDADGVFHDFEWDADGQLVAIVDALGHRTTLTYDAAGQPTGVVDGSGVETILENDAAGRLVRSILGDGATTFTWSEAGRAVSGSNAVGVGWAASWGDNGSLDRFTDATGSTVTYEWDRFSNVAAVVAPDGGRYEHTYDPIGNLVGLTDPEGNTAVREYDADGNIVVAVDPAGRRTEVERDAMGRAVRVTAPDGAVTRWDYHPMGGVARVVRPDATEVHSEVDDHGRTVAVVDETGNRFELVYTPAGRLLERRHPTGRVERWHHDEAGRVVGLSTNRSANDDTDRVDLVLDGAGRVLEAVAPEGRTTYAYEHGQLVSADGPVRSTRFELDAAGRIVTRIDGEGGRTTYEWDARSQLVAASDPAGVTARFGHDERGRLTSVHAANGDVTSFAYDAIGRLTSTTDPTGATASVRLDAFSSVLGRTARDGTALDHVLDAAGRPVGIRSGGQDLASYRYDARGRLIEATDRRAGSTSTLTWDPTGRLASVSGPTGALTIGHDADGTTTGWTLDGDATTVRRSVSGRIIGFDDALVGGVAGPSAPQVTRDRAGRIVADWLGATYRYDVGGRLVEALDATGVRRSFAYDAAGLLEAEVGPGGTTHYQRGILGRIEVVVCLDGTEIHFDYDAAGRRVAADHSDGSSVRYRWDELDRLVGIDRTDADGATSSTEIGLDGLGRPAWIGSTSVVWDDALGGHPLRIGSRRYVHVGSRTRAIGDGVQPADPDWSEPSRDPWGDLGPDEPHIGFAGELTAAGLVWMGSRVYDPSTREFLSPDPLLAVPGRAGHAGVYSYGFLDPVNHLDPSGLQPISKADYEEILERDSSTVWSHAWDQIKEDPLGTALLVGVVATGVVLCATGVGGPAGAAILIGAGAAAAQGLATKSFDPKTVAVSGAVSGLTAGVGDKILNGARLTMGSAAAMGAADGGGVYLVDSAIHGRPITAEGMMTSLAFGGAGGTAGYGLSNLASRLPVRMPGSRPTTPAITNDSPVVFNVPRNGATPAQIQQIRDYVDGSNQALLDGALSPTGRVSTGGQLRIDASNAAAAERAANPGAYGPGQHVGHVPDTTWTGQAQPHSWMPLDGSINTSLGSQAAKYPVGHQPSGFWFHDDYVAEFGTAPPPPSG